MADGIPIRQGDLLPVLRAIAFTEDARVDLTQFTGGITFRMVSGSTVVTGPATGDANGNLTYVWQSGDTAVAGTYQAKFEAVDGAGRSESFPTDHNLEIVVFPDL